MSERSTSLAPASPAWYRGQRFRSHLEARWAVFYDELGLEWTYEPTEIRLGSDLGAYWPDFYIPALDAYVEIKGSAQAVAAEGALERMNAVSHHTACAGYVFAGWLDLDKQDENESAYAVFGRPALGYSRFNRWCECVRCGRLHILCCRYPKRLRMAYAGLVAERDCPCRDDDGYDTYESRTPRLRAAYQAAQRYRFAGDRPGSLARDASARERPRPLQPRLFVVS